MVDVVQSYFFREYVAIVVSNKHLKLSALRKLWVAAGVKANKYHRNHRKYIVCRICGEEGHSWQCCGND